MESKSFWAPGMFVSFEKDGFCSKIELSYIVRNAILLSESRRQEGHVDCIFS